MTNSTAATPEIGAHCALASCNLNDFLPIKCRCEQLYCRDHISPESHSCPAIQTAGTDLNNLSVPSSTEKLERCAASGCNKPSLEAFVSESSRADASGRKAAVCPRCKEAFCATHREASAHACKAEDPAASSTSKNAAARALLEKHFPSISSGSTLLNSKANSRITSASKTPLNPKKADHMRKVQVMKMRHKAQPGDPRDKGKYVAMDDKIHLHVSVNNSDNEGSFWFRKTISTGKALDLLVSHFTAIDYEKPSLVRYTDGDPGILRNDKTLGEQLTDGDNIGLIP
ncbi:unnamed protein product [Somion occarium]|uniref:AN1-type domain-containing protein n=1 Tax=Somion occarium TaxID=3059160 RepID=A0ABP1D7D2_9APHY